MRWTNLRRELERMEVMKTTVPARTVADPPISDPLDRIRAALDPESRAQAFEQWKAEQYELQEARRQSSRGSQ